MSKAGVVVRLGGVVVRALDLRSEITICAVECHLTQVIRTHCLLSPSSIICDQHQLGDGKQAHRTTHWPCVHGNTAPAGAWLRVLESEISTILWCKWLGKGLTAILVHLHYSSLLILLGNG